MGVDEVRAYLTHLAVQKQVAASTPQTHPDVHRVVSQLKPRFVQLTPFWCEEYALQKYMKNSFQTLSKG
jgi:hypothetical protein